MKKIIILCILASMATVLNSCTKEISENEFKFVWHKYLSREFEDSFDEKQSIEQRKEILKDIADEYGLDYNYLLFYLEKKYPDKYNRLFFNVEK